MTKADAKRAGRYYLGMPSHFLCVTVITFNYKNVYYSKCAREQLYKYYARAVSPVIRYLANGHFVTLVLEPFEIGETVKITGTDQVCVCRAI